MKDYGIFDILGPIMVGPSSSHTAGAARLGYMSMVVAGRPFESVKFYLHGSFAKTMTGHGTDKALLAGVLGMAPDDANLPRAFEVAKERGLKYEFVEKDLGNVHPNTVKTEFTLEDGSNYYVTGSSVGGGNIVIMDIDGTEVDFTGSQPTLIIKNKDNKGVIAHISRCLADADVNIATMTVSREDDIATMIVTTDSFLSKDLLIEIEECKDIIYTKKINPNKE